MSRKGIPNKKKAHEKQALILLIQAKYPEYNPILSMVDIANDESNDINLRASMHKEVSPYIMPKLKAMEITGQIDANIVYKPMVKRLDGSMDSDDA